MEEDLLYGTDEPAENESDESPYEQLENWIRDHRTDAEADFQLLLMRLLFPPADPRFYGEFHPGALGTYLELLQTEFQQYATDRSTRVQISHPGQDDPATALDRTVVTIVCPDHPFVIDSLEALLDERDLSPLHRLHGDLRVDTDAEPPRILTDHSSPNTQVISLFLGPEAEPEQEYLQHELEAMFAELVPAVRDFEGMLEKLDSLRSYLRSTKGSEESPPDAQLELLDFLADENFVFQGYSFQPSKGKGQATSLGILEDGNLQAPVPLPSRNPKEGEDVPDSRITVTKINRVSRIYRRDRLTLVAIVEPPQTDHPPGVHLFLGLFTNRVLSEPPATLPLLRQKFETLLESEGITEHTHRYREYYTLFNNLPLDLLFSYSPRVLREELHALRSTDTRDRFRLRARPEPERGGLSMMIIMRRDRFSEDIRGAIKQEIKSEFEPEYIDGEVSLGETGEAWIYFYLQTDRTEPRTRSFEELEDRFYELTQTWLDALQKTIHETLDEPRADEVAPLYRDAFPDEYRALVEPELALNDIANLEQLRSGTEDPPLIDAVNPAEGSSSHLIFYHTEQIRLNEIMPTLSNHGFSVVDQSSFDITLGETTYHLHLFRVQDSHDQRLPLEDRKELILRSLRGVFFGRLRDDMLNQLVVQRGFKPRTLNLLRLYKNYFHQLGPAIKLESINRTLLQNPDLTERLVDFFRQKFDPGLDVDDRTSRIEELRTDLRTDLEAVEQRAAYEVLRAFHNQIDATLRTNFYQSPDYGFDLPDQNAPYLEGKPYLSVKIDSRVIDSMPRPRPRYEIFVYSPWMEGIHLRNAPIARGGIRWSDRRDDYRTEVLELMKTQAVKNALIVPDGAKGGFVLKEEYLPEEDPLPRQAHQQYSVFMKGLLDLTDNRVDGEVVPPPDVVRYDDDDPYLVVAADKGTATFSDRANEIAAGYDFWLGDAFASGGSVGYDHKELGITAKGTWECVKRHLREQGTDLEEETIQVVGIGDMSGDVFGNGMILSNSFELVAAFDHRHIFLDPNPDPGSSFEERQRLFERENSSWDDYSREVLSDEGGIFPRSANTLTLNDTQRDLLGLSETDVQPDEVIRAILRADVDLLWNGGIGTYIKSSRESHAAVGDPQNDAFRVDADQVQADIIGEGGNLGITQRGRIELSRNGVRLNTDFIDNSGGVDLSDHEVNLKILLQESLKRGILSEQERPGVLESHSEEIVEKVLRDNYDQSGTISLEAHQSRDKLDDYRHLLNHLEESIQLDREVETLPDERELRDRKRAGEPMTRPELAVILSYTKRDLYRRTLQESWPEPTVIRPYLEEYFPEELIETHAEALVDHPLRLEIALTTLVNHAVNSAGCTFFHRLEEELGTDLISILKSYVSADRIARTDSLRQDLFSLDGTIPASTQYEAWQTIVDRLAHTVTWFVVAVPESPLFEGFLDYMRTAMDDHFESILTHLQPAQQDYFETTVSGWTSRGFDRDFAERLARLSYLVPALEIILIHRDNEQWDIGELSALYFQVGELLKVDWILGQILEPDAPTRWDEFAYRNLGVDVYEILRNIVGRLIEQGRKLEDFRRENQDTLERIDDIQRSIAREESDQFAAYQYLVQRIRSLL